MPDNGLANLAGALITKGHTTTILDYATVNIIELLSPHEYKEEILYSVNKIMDSMLQGLSPDIKDVEAFQKTSAKIDSLRRKNIREIAKEICGWVNKNKIDFVGMKLWTGDGFEGSLIIAEELKKNNPRIPIFAGGPHVHWFHKQVFDVTNLFDAVADGEGEETITLLAEYVEGKMSLRDIPNMIYKEKDNIITNPIKRVEDLDNLPLPVYSEEVYPAMKGNQKIKIILLDESRGCPNSCNFCIHPYIAGHKWRLVNPILFVEKLERMQKEYGINVFRFAGSNPPISLLGAIAKEICKKKINIIFSSNMHARGLRKEDLYLLKKAGCHCGFFGIESGSQKILDTVINKNTNVREIKEAFAMCKDAGILNVGSIIMPAPLETEETKKETLDLLLEIKPDSTLVCFPGLIPGTQWCKNRRKYGFKIKYIKNLFKEAMTYKIDVFSPPILWKPLIGFTMNNKTFQAIAGESYKFNQILEQNGLLTQVTDEMFIMAGLLNMIPREFRDLCMQSLLSGNRENMEKIVTDINERTASI